MPEKRSDRWPEFGVAAALLCALALFPAIKAVRYQSSSAWIGFGCAPAGPCFARRNQTLLPEKSVVFLSGGYDGQFYFYLAGELGGGGGAELDSDAFRRSRILLPMLLAPAYRLGGGASLLYAFPLSCLLASAFLLWAALRHVPASRQSLLASCAVILSPIATLSIQLSLADLLALCLGAAAAIYFFRSVAAGQDRQFWLQWAAALALATAAAFAKETALAASLAAGPAALIAGANSGRRQLLLAMASTLLPLFALSVWWNQTGFSLAMAAERGDLPGGGLMAFWSNPDAIFSGRTIHAIWICLLMIWIPIAMWRWRPPMIGGVEASAADLFRRSYVVGCAAAALALSLRATNEYWDAYANLARLFLPAYLPLPALAILSPAGDRLERGYVYLAAMVTALCFIWSLRVEAVGVLLNHMVLQR